LLPLIAASEHERDQHTDQRAAASRRAAKRTAIEPGRRSFADLTAKGRDDFNCAVVSHIELPGFSIWHRVPRVGFGTESFGPTVLLEK
jgi:hypothetical protein